MEDLCIVCAEPLLFTAYGPCGHKETCSKCVSRLRSVIKDQRCALCQQQVEAVFVTRFMGDYTATVPADEFPKLPVRQGPQPPQPPAARSASCRASLHRPQHRPSLSPLTLPPLLSPRPTPGSRQGGGAAALGVGTGLL